MTDRESAFSQMHRVDDPRLLRAVAHPVRNRILAELSATGPLRAADIAGQIGVPANQASFHLRQLAKYGLVEEAPELARDGRDRVWRMVNERGLTVNLDELEETPGGRAAVTVYRRGIAAQVHALVDSAIGRRQEKGVHVMVSDHALRLTEDEAKELSVALTDLVEDWRSGKAGTTDSDRRTYRLTMMVQPYDNSGEE